jgi:hypothetical protein
VWQSLIEMDALEVIVALTLIQFAAWVCPQMGDE